MKPILSLSLALLLSATSLEASMATNCSALPRSPVNSYQSYVSSRYILWGSRTVFKNDLTLVDYRPPEGILRNLRATYCQQDVECSKKILTNSSPGPFTSQQYELHIGVRSHEDAWHGDFQHSTFVFRDHIEKKTPRYDHYVHINQLFLYRNYELNRHSFQVGLMGFRFNEGRKTFYVFPTIHSHYLIPPIFFTYSYQHSDEWRLNVMRDSALSLYYTPKEVPLRASLSFAGFSPSIYYDPPGYRYFLQYNDLTLSLRYDFNDYIFAQLDFGAYGTTHPVVLSDLHQISFTRGKVRYQTLWESLSEANFRDHVSPFIGLVLSGSW